MNLTSVDAEHIRSLARERQAPNQCQVCKAFRIDGEPPTVHHHGCIHHHPSQNEVLWVAEVPHERGRK